MATLFGMNAASWVTIGVVVVGGVSNYAVTSYRVDKVEEQVKAANVEAGNRVNRFEIVSQAYESRLRAVEIAQASQTSDLRNIQIGINEIKEQIRTLNSARP